MVAQSAKIAQSGHTAYHIPNMTANFAILNHKNTWASIDLQAKVEGFKQT